MVNPIMPVWRTLLCLVLVVLLAGGCDAPRDEAIRLGIAGKVGNLDPRFATDATSARVNRLIYRRLVDFDEQLMPRADLAEWEVLNPTHYRFRLGSEGREFHDGSYLEAADVVATYRFILDPKNASPHRGALGLIERVEATDADTVEFRLSRGDPLFPGYLVIGIVPAERIDSGHSFQDQPIGSGPVRFVSRPQADRVRLLRIADQQPLELLRVADPTVRALKLLRGEIDLLQNDMPAELLGYLDGRDGVTVVRAPGSNFSYIGFNLEDTHTGRWAVRKAIAHAIDRQAIIRHVLAGAAQPAGALLPPSHWAGATDLRGDVFDPDRARELLQTAGYTTQNPLRLTYKTSSDPLRIRLATIIQDQLAGVGIEVRLQTYDWGTFYGDIKAGRFQMYSLAWVGIKTPDIFRYVFHSASVPPTGANRGRLTDAATDALIEAAERSGDLATQAPLWRRLQTRIAEQMVYVPLWYEDHVVALRGDIRAYPLAADGNYDGLLSVRRQRTNNRAAAL